MADNLDIQTIAGIGALGVGGYFLYKYFKEKEEEEEEEPPYVPPAPPDEEEEERKEKEEEEERKKPRPGEKFPITITDPKPLEKWGKFAFHSVNVTVSNPYNSERKVWVGLSFLHDETGVWYDYKVETKTIRANSTKKFSWWIYGTPHEKGPLGLYWVVSAVWRNFPAPGDQRIGEANSSVIFTWTGL